MVEDYGAIVSQRARSAKPRRHVEADILNAELTSFRNYRNRLAGSMSAAENAWEHPEFGFAYNLRERTSGRKYASSPIAGRNAHRR
jgi:hypothetical protein